MGIPIMPTGYRHGYTLGYRWVFMDIDGYFDDLKKAAGSWLLAYRSLLPATGYRLPATSFRLPAEEPLRPASSLLVEAAFSNQWSAENRGER